MKIYLAGVIGPRREKMLLKLRSKKRLISYYEIVSLDSGYSAGGDFKLLITKIKGGRK